MIKIQFGLGVLVMVSNTHTRYLLTAALNP